MGALKQLFIFYDVIIIAVPSISSPAHPSIYRFSSKPAFPKTSPPHRHLTPKATQVHCYSQRNKGLKCVKTLFKWLCKQRLSFGSLLHHVDILMAFQKIAP